MIAGLPKLLIVDDQKDLAVSLGAIASTIGFDVQVSTSPVEFQKLFRATKPQYAVIDIVMPNIDGIELAQWTFNESPLTNIVLISGYNPYWGFSARKLLESNSPTNVTFLEKPVSKSSLQSALGR